MLDSYRTVFAHRGSLAFSATGMLARLPILSPEDEVTLLEQAGFTDVQLFYVAFGFRGWVAYA